MKAEEEKIIKRRIKKILRKWNLGEMFVRSEGVIEEVAREIMDLLRVERVKK